MLKVLVGYPSPAEEATVVERSLAPGARGAHGPDRRRLAELQAADGRRLRRPGDRRLRGRRSRDGHPRARPSGPRDHQAVHRVRRQPAWLDQPHPCRPGPGRDPRPPATSSPPTSPSSPATCSATASFRASRPRRGGHAGPAARRAVPAVPAADARSRREDACGGRARPDPVAPRAVARAPRAGADARGAAARPRRSRSGAASTACSPGEYRSAFEIGGGTELCAGPPVPAGRRRAPDRLERHRPDGDPARARPRSRAGARHVAPPRRIAVDGLRHRRPAQGGRGRGRCARDRPPRHAARQPAGRRSPSVVRSTAVRPSAAAGPRRCSAALAARPGDAEPGTATPSRSPAARAAVRRGRRRTGRRSWSSSPTSAGRVTGSRAGRTRPATSVLTVEVRDPREDELTDVGDLTLVDAETGREVRVDTSSRRSASASPTRPPRSARPSPASSARRRPSHRAVHRAAGCGPSRPAAHPGNPVA